MRRTLGNAAMLVMIMANLYQNGSFRYREFNIPYQQYRKVFSIH